MGAQRVIRGRPATFCFALNWQGEAADVRDVTLAMVSGTRRVLAAVAAQMA